MQRFDVLLVDDEEDFVSTLAERLELRGFDTVTATDGETALERVETEKPQVVVLDVMMPGIGGLEVLRQIKRRHPHIQVILLTGRCSTREGIDGMRLGAFDYLMKPLQIEELIKKMREASAVSQQKSGKEQGE